MSARKAKVVTRAVAELLAKHTELVLQLSRLADDDILTEGEAGRIMASLLKLKTVVESFQARR